MRATNLKLVLLSGTPVINAFELGLMMNMLRGLIVSFRIRLNHPQVNLIIRKLPKFYKTYIKLIDLR